MAVGVTKDEVGAQRPSSKVSSAKAADDGELASAQPDADRVAIVSRDVNGDAAQSRNHTVLIDDDADDAEQDAANNVAGEALGAKHVKPGPRTSGKSVDEEKRAAEESAQLRKIRNGEL